MRRFERTTALASIVMIAAACAGANAATSAPDEPVSAPALDCAPDVTDCDDTHLVPDDLDVDAARDRSRALLGLAEDELPADVRIGRIDDEEWMLTEDYVLGRATVELDTGADGVARVTSVRVELVDGPETLTG